MEGLESDADRTVRGLSGGMKRRLEIVRGMLHGPRVLFLDEPTLGLDVSARATIRDALRTLRSERSVTLFLTTHDMDEAATLCDRIAIVDRGRVVVEGAPDELTAVRCTPLLTVRRGRDQRPRRWRESLASRRNPRDGGTRRASSRARNAHPPALLDAAREHEVYDVGCIGRRWRVFCTTRASLRGGRLHAQTVAVSAPRDESKTPSRSCIASGYRFSTARTGSANLRSPRGRRLHRLWPRFRRAVAHRNGYARISRREPRVVAGSGSRWRNDADHGSRGGFLRVVFGGAGLACGIVVGRSSPARSRLCCSCSCWLHCSPRSPGCGSRIPWPRCSL